MKAMMEVTSEITGTVWKVLLAQDQRLGEGESIAILESMKMEIPVELPAAGRVQQILVTEGQSIEEGQVIAIVERD